MRWCSAVIAARTSADVGSMRWPGGSLAATDGASGSGDVAAAVTVASVGSGSTVGDGGAGGPFPSVVAATPEDSGAASGSTGAAGGVALSAAAWGAGAAT